MLTLVANAESRVGLGVGAGVGAGVGFGSGDGDGSDSNEAVVNKEGLDPDEGVGLGSWD